MHSLFTEIFLINAYLKILIQLSQKHTLHFHCVKLFCLSVGSRCTGLSQGDLPMAERKVVCPLSPTIFLQPGNNHSQLLSCPSVNIGDLNVQTLPSDRLDPDLSLPLCRLVLN